MYEQLLKQWANEQGFQTWSQDHVAVLRNLTSWLNQHAAQHSVHLTRFPQCKTCEYNPCDLANNSDYCPARK